MTGTGNERTENRERRPSTSAVKNAWGRTLEDMDALADEREEEGWDVVRVVAGSTTPASPSARDDDRLGLVFVIPDNQAEAFEAAFERGEYPFYEVYRETVEDTVFLVVEYRDPRAESVILLAGTYELRNAAGMASAATEQETIYTYLQTLDGTLRGTFEHDEYEKFVPNPERVARWHDNDF